MLLHKLLPEFFEIDRQPKKTKYIQKTEPSEHISKWLGPIF